MAQHTILVVEDDLLTAEVVRRCLEGEGHVVRVAGDGLAASRALADEHPDLVILDLMLPDLDGWELCATIRTLPDPELSAVPIVMLTSRSTAQDRLRGFKAGADDYITKPFSLQELAVKVGRLLDRQRRLKDRPHDLADVNDLVHHELKNHLIAVSGFARRLDLQVETISRETLKRYVGYIRQSADHLASLVEDVLLFRQIQGGRLPFEPEAVTLGEIVEDVLALHAGSAQEKGLTLRSEVGADAPPVHFSPHAAKICLANLVENAVKYTQAGGLVTVRVRTEGDGQVVLEVEDTGPGIPDDERERIFDEFYRGRQTKRATKGTGLGLYIVRSLARSLGADATLAAGQRSEGSRFRLVFRPTS
jgi:signal transduction histidine kinase